MAESDAGASGGMEAAGGPARRVDPYRVYNWKVDIGGQAQCHFTSCSGLGVDITPIRYREGGDAQIVHQLAGPVSYVPVTLRYGMTDSIECRNWLYTAISGNVERRNVTIVMLGPDGISEGVRWNLLEAWPCKWRAAPLDALGNEFAIESLTLAYEMLEQV